MNQPHDNANALQEQTTSLPESILIGIAWAENEHEFCAAMPDGTIIRGAFKQKRSAIDQWIAELSAIAPNAKLDVCIETSTGDYDIVRFLPGSSFRTHARIIAALGDDRSRFASAECLQAAAGIAPITIQSGKSRVVAARWSSSKFMRQTFHEYAGLSIKKCAWAKA